MAPFTIFILIENSISSWFLLKTKQILRTTKEVMMYSNKTSQFWRRSMRIDSRERRSSLTPFILLPAHFSSRPHPSSLRGEGLNFFGFAESSIRPSAPSSLVALGGGRSERRAGTRRRGQGGALFIFENTSFQLCVETSSKSPENRL